METTLAPQEIHPDEQAAELEVAPEAEAPSEAASEVEITPELIEALQQLDASEHAVLVDMLVRATRDREEQGPFSELSFIANDLKSHPDSDDWLVMLKISEKVAPDLQKTYPECARIPLSKDLSSVDESLSEVLANRSSKRDYSGGPLSLEELSSLLHQAYGVKSTVMAYNRPDVPVRFVPTTGGLQCAEVYMVINAVEGIEQGLYHYHAVDHCLEQLERGNFRWKLTDLCPQHGWLSEASVVFFVAPYLPRILWKYGRRAYRMAHIDTGIVSQTLHLVATGLKLNSCLIMGYQDDLVNDMLGLDGRDEFVVLMMALGRNTWEPGPLKRDEGLGAEAGGDGHAGDGHLS